MAKPTSLSRSPTARTPGVARDVSDATDRRPLRVLILGLNYAPEPIGIGPYTTGMAEALVAAGHSVTVVCGKPYYPAWQVDPAYAGGGARRSVENGVTVVRLPIYVPAVPSGGRRLVHHASFAASAQVRMLLEARRLRPDVVIGIAPSLISLVAARTIARLFGAKLWIHVQDFEVEAAFATGLLNGDGRSGKMARWFETWSLDADRISSISLPMCAKLAASGIAPDKIVEFRNWASIDKVKPLVEPSSYRTEWGIATPHVALYSGNIANKQGIDIVVEVARLLADRADLTIVVCGNGPNREALMARAAGLGNIRFFDLQPMDRLSDLLGLASIHLLPQIEGAADLVLPSKLTNMLASGRAVVATAPPETGLAREVEGCGIVTPPGDAPAMAAAIRSLLEDDALRERYAVEARVRAEERWSKDRILARFETELRASCRPA
ncbi:WcaI family glycosyltransferase [Sphingomonas arantia]|uniref:WcaI family glycosyltransferase n=1 Tax=Sphingomonas arantia TaxID=1460676 RepID=A0ABW4TWL5_9SPHN